MIKKTIKCGWITGFALLLLFSSGVYLAAQDYEGYYEDQAYTNPALSQEQMDEIRKLEEQLDARLSPMHQRLQSRYQELDRLESASNPDNRKIDKKWSEINRLESDISDLELKHEQRIAKLVPQYQQSYGVAGAYGQPGYPGAGMGASSYYYGGARLGRGPGGRGMGRLGGGAGYGIGGGRGYAAGSYGTTGGVRLGRGPCGSGLGRLSGSAGYGAGRAGYGAGRVGYGIGRTGYGAGRVGYGIGRTGYGAGRVGQAYGSGTYAYRSRNINGGVRMGPGPCGLGIGQRTAPRYYRRRMR